MESKLDQEMWRLTSWQTKKEERKLKEKGRRIIG
jgi:hypothetical protein